MNETGAASVVIHTDPERLWSMVSDVTRVGEWSPGDGAGGVARPGDWAGGRGPVRGLQPARQDAVVDGV